MHNPFPQLYLIFVICACLVQCKSPEEVTPTGEVDVPVAWQSHPEIVLDRRLQIQAYATEDRMWLMSNNYLLSLNAEHRLVSDELVAPFGNEVWYRSFLSEALFATEIQGKPNFDLRLTHNPDVKVEVDLREFEPAVQQVNNGYLSPMAINDQGQILIGGRVNGASAPTVTGLPLFLLQAKQVGDSLEVSLEKKLWVHKGNFNYANWNRLDGIHAFGDTFYFSTSGPAQFFRLLPDGEPEALFPLRLAHPLWVHDTLLVIGYREDINLSWYFLPPGSSTWERRDFGFFENGFARYEAVQNRVIAYRGGQIWEMITNKDVTSLKPRELNRLGLEQATIHDLQVFKGRVYLCTDRGLFVKSLTDFFTYMPTE